MSDTPAPSRPDDARKAIERGAETALFSSRWLMAVLREWPDEGVSLRDLDWIIGTAISWDDRHKL